MSEKTVYIFTKRGEVQLLSQPDSDGVRKVGLLISFDEATAKQFGKQEKMSPAIVGSVQGETLTAHADLAAKDGAAGIWVCLLTPEGKVGVNFFKFGEHPK